VRGLIAAEGVGGRGVPLTAGLGFQEALALQRFLNLAGTGGVGRRLLAIVWATGFFLELEVFFFDDVDFEAGFFAEGFSFGKKPPRLTTSQQHR